MENKLSYWGDACIAWGQCAVIPSALRGHVKEMALEGHLGIVKLKQRGCDMVWWPGIDRDLEELVWSYMSCLISGKTGSPAPPPLHPLDWPFGP